MSFTTKPSFWEGKHEPTEATFQMDGGSGVISSCADLFEKSNPSLAGENVFPVYSTKKEGELFSEKTVPSQTPFEIKYKTHTKRDGVCISDKDTLANVSVRFKLTADCQPQP